ncbi:hypothetical protein QJL52_11535 [Clostridioides difficile]|nr:MULTISPECIES: hypothetical protein [Clostridioides]MDI2882359.1 hypothetical protein [Clostridioides difficile]
MISLDEVSSIKFNFGSTEYRLKFKKVFSSLLSSIEFVTIIKSSIVM